nr:hypothetical protein [Tanacetum cinerariifolium]
MMKKPHNLDSQANDTSLGKRVYRLEEMVKAMSKFNIQVATDESIEARLKQIELPKGGLDFKKSKLEKAFKQNVPKTSWNKSATAIYEQKSRLYRMIKEVKAFNNHPAHKAPYDALVVSLRPEQNWFPELEKTTKAPRDFDDVMGSTIDFLNFMKYILKKDTLTKADFEAKFFFNKDLEYLRSGNLEERKYTTSFTKTKATRIGKRCLMREDKVYIAIRPWSDKDKRWVESTVKVIKKTLHKRRIIRSLKCYVGGRKHEEDYRLLTRTD